MNDNLDVLIYTTKDCSYCKKAKLIFKKFKIKYNEIIIKDELDRIEMSRLSNGKKTVPQIFIKNKHIYFFSVSSFYQLFLGKLKFEAV